MHKFHIWALHSTENNYGERKWSSCIGSIDERDLGWVVQSWVKITQGLWNLNSDLKALKEIQSELKPLYMESSPLTIGRVMEWVSVPIRSWKKKRMGRGEGGREREMLCLAMLAWIPIIHLSKGFIKHSIASFPLFKQRWHIPCRSLPKHKSSE